MPNKAIAFKVPSLKIDRKFLKALGKIVEGEFNDQHRMLVHETQRRIAEQQARIRKEGLGSDELQAKLNEVRDREEWRSERKMVGQVRYVFESGSESVTFESSDEIARTTLLPNDVKSIKCSSIPSRQKPR